MVGAGADPGQAEGDVDRLIKINRLERREALVVVERDDDIEFPAQRAPENGVARFAAREAGKFLAQFIEPRVEAVTFVGAEEALFARVGIKSTHAYARLVRTQGARQPVGLRYGSGEAGFIERAGDIHQGNVPGGEDDAQFTTGKRHGRLAAPARGEKFGLAGESEARFLHPDFGNGAGDGGGKFPVAATGGCGFQGVERDFCSGDGWLSRLNREIRRTNGDALDAQGVQPALRADEDDARGFRRIGVQPRGNDFGADASGIAAGESERQRGFNHGGHGEKRIGNYDLRIMNPEKSAISPQ